MRVLAIHSGWQLGGSTLNAGFAIKTLARRGHAVVILNRYQHDEGSRYLQRCGAELIWFEKFSLKMNTTTILESGEATLAREFITTLQDIVKWFTGLYLTVKYVRRYRPDIVYVTDAALPQCIVAARGLGVPVICELQAELIRGRWGLRRAIYRWLLAKADRLFAITRFHLEPFAPADRCTHAPSVIPNTIDRDLQASTPVDIRKCYGIPEGKKVISFFGGASPIKGYAFWLQVAEQVSADRDDAVFVIAGPFHRDFTSQWGRGSTREGKEHTQELFTFVAAHPKLDVRIVGELTDVMSVIAQSDLVAVTNPFPHFSRTVVEAFQSSVPVLVSDDKFGRDIIEHRRTGWLARFGVVGEWVALVNYVLDHPPEAAQAAHAGHQTFCSRFSPDVVAGQIVQLFEGLHPETQRPPEHARPAASGRH
jgi:glycosyltransferase involved in cell wall biosynthesis